MRIPARQPREALIPAVVVQAPKAVNEDTTATVKPTLLIVEDEESVRELLAVYLGSKYKIETASTVQEAKAKLGNANIVLSDNGISNSSAQDGIELRQYMLSRPDLGKIPFVLMSGQSISFSQLIGLDIHYVFEKPFARGLALISPKLEEALTKEKLIAELRTKLVNALKEPSSLTKFNDFTARLLSSPYANELNEYELYDTIVRGNFNPPYKHFDFPDEQYSIKSFVESL